MTTNPSQTQSVEPAPTQTRELKRNLIAFWIIGLCNNLVYVVMVKAALDSPGRPTSFILFAAILPAILVKLAAPFFMQKVNYHIRLAFVILCITASLLIFAFSGEYYVSFLAVAIASLCSGLGEITFLGLLSHFKRSTVSAWSSGTGMSGIIGSVAILVLHHHGSYKHKAVLSLLVVPFIVAISIWVILKFPSKIRKPFSANKEVEPVTMLADNSTVIIPVSTNVDPDRTKYMSIKMKLKIIYNLKKYTIPLFIVYLAEYAINLGLCDSRYFTLYWKEGPKIDSMYYQVGYHIAVFISCLSVYLFHIKKVIYLSIGQCLLLVLLLLDGYFNFIDLFEVTLCLSILEGLLGGGVYVNTFFRMSEEVEPDIREFALGATGFSDACAVFVAGTIAMLYLYF